jgi:hypothetical protein
MLELLIVVVRALTLVLRGQREVVLENLALRQQLAAYLPPNDAMPVVSLACAESDWYGRELAR